MSKKLLLADDSITIQKVIGITFANEDYELSVVDNGDAAFELARKLCPDLILADVFMPGKNGYELCAAIKKDPILCNTPLLLLTGTFEPFDENKAKAAGANSWIAKPFESQALIDRVEELLARASAPVTPAPASAAAPTPPKSPVAPPAPVQAIPATLTPPTPFMEPAVGMDDDIWGDEPAVATIQENASSNAAADWQAVDDADDLWGGVALEDEPAAEAEGGGFDIELDDDWGDLAEEVSPAGLQMSAPPVGKTVLVTDQRPVAAPAVVEPLPATDSGWDESEDDILALDEMDILEEEDIIETPVAKAFAGAQAAPVAVGAAWDDVAQPTSAAAGSAGTAWELTDEEDTIGDPAWNDLAGEVEEAPAASIWDIELDDTAPVAPAAVMVAPVRAPAALTTAAVEAQIGALSEEDIARIVEKVAGAVIERLAPTLLEKVIWEVVPDLTEAMIRDEIRTIKEGIR
jgi:CheY-like chemotaxis protein